MKTFLVISSFLLSFSSFAQEVYTFDCASDLGYIAVRVEAEKFNSQLKQVQGEIEIHSDTGSEEFTNAFFSNRSLSHSTGAFRFSVGMGRSGSASIRGNFIEQSGSFSVRTGKNNMTSHDAVCRFDNGLEVDE